MRTEQREHAVAGVSKHGSPVTGDDIAEPSQRRMKYRADVLGIEPPADRRRSNDVEKQHRNEPQSVVATACCIERFEPSAQWRQRDVDDGAPKLRALALECRYSRLDVGTIRVGRSRQREKRSKNGGRPDSR